MQNNRKQALEQQRLEFEQETRTLLNSNKGFVSGEEHAEVLAEYASQEAARAVSLSHIT